MNDGSFYKVGLKPVTLRSSATPLNGWYLFNSNAVTAYLQIFDVKSADEVIVGTTRPTLSLGIPAGSAANLSADGIRDLLKGLVVAATTTSDGAVALPSLLEVNLFFCS